MKEKEPKPPPTSEDASLQRDIRSGDKFTLAKAIGRMGGDDLMKGASPVTRKRQSELEIKQYLDRHLVDIEGALRVILLRRVTESKTLLEMGYEEPIAALEVVLERILHSEQILRRFVQAVDAEWGRVNFERPRVEREGHPPRPDDPYTFASVRSTLARLMKALRGE